MSQLTFIASQPERLFGVGALRQDEAGVHGGMDLGPWSTGPDGQPSLGALGVFADEVLGYALMASLPQGSWSISTEIWLDVVAELPRPGSALTGRACPVAEGSFSVGELCGPSGEAVVLCRQRGRAVTAPDVAAAGQQVEQVEQVRANAHHAPGMEAQLGLRAEGDAVVLPMRRELLNPNGMLHGGVSLAASEVVATRHRVASGSELRTSSVHIVHTRGVPLDADAVVFRAETRYAGRSLWVTDVIGTVAGRTSTVATVTAES